MTSYVKDLKKRIVKTRAFYFNPVQNCTSLKISELSSKTGGVVNGKQ